MRMTTEERMLTVLNRGKQDRLPATLHQWQEYNLQNYMGGKSDIKAFREVGLDAAITIFIPSTCSNPVNLQSSTWKHNKKTFQVKILSNAR